MLSTWSHRAPRSLSSERVAFQNFKCYDFSTQSKQKYPNIHMPNNSSAFHSQTYTPYSAQCLEAFSMFIHGGSGHHSDQLTSKVYHDVSLN